MLKMRINPKNYFKMRENVRFFDQILSKVGERQRKYVQESLKSIR